MSLRPQTTDRYGRTVAEVLREGRNVNLELVRMGQAFVYEQYLDQCHGLAYMQAQRMAEFQRAGVWSVPGGITRPWDWRAANRDGGRPRQRAWQSQRGVNLGVMSGSGSGSRSTVDKGSQQRGEGVLPKPELARGSGVSAARAHLSRWRWRR